MDYSALLSRHCDTHDILHLFSFCIGLALFFVSKLSMKKLKLGGGPEAITGEFDFQGTLENFDKEKEMVSAATEQPETQPVSRVLLRFIGVLILLGFIGF